MAIWTGGSVCTTTIGLRTRRLLLVAILLVAAAVRGGSLSGPFGAGWQHLGAGFTIIARNYLRYGLAATRGAMVMNPEPAPPEQWVHFTHHPPGMALATAATMAVIGDGPLALKLHGLLFSLLEVVLVALLVERAVSPVAGLTAAFVTAVLPAGAFYATHGSELGPQAISLSLLVILLDEVARARNPERPRSGGVLAAAAAAVFFEWLVLPVVFFVGLRDLFGCRYRRAAWFLAFPWLAVGLHVLHMRWATGSFAGDRAGSLYDSMLSHGVVGAKLLAESVGGERMVVHAARNALFLFTGAGLIAAAVGLAIVTTRLAVAPERRARLGGIFLATLTLAAGYTLPFPRGIVVHRYWLTIALPWLALLIGAAVDGAWRWPLLRAATLVGMLLVGVVSTRTVLALQAEERTPFFEELGNVLHERTGPGDRIYTTENYSEALIYYAQRSIIGDFTDSAFGSRHDDHAEASLGPAWFAIVAPSFDPKSVRCEVLQKFLERHYACARVPLPRSARTLLLFDLARLTDPPHDH